MKTPIIKNPIVKNILSAAAVAVFGFILLNAAFLLDFLFQSSVKVIVRFFTPTDLWMVLSWFPGLLHLLFTALIGLISWPIFRSKLGVLYKSIYLTVPLAVVFATIGIFLYRWPAAVYSAGALFAIGVMYFLHRTKKPWLYYFTLILVGAAMAVMTIGGADI